MTSPTRRAGRLAAALAVSILLPAGALVPTVAAAAAAPEASSVAVAGDLDDVLGCPGDWQPDCDQAQMTRRPADGVWARTAALPEGTYAYKAAIDRSWAVNYGLHAVAGGANIPLTVPAGGATVTFLYDDTTHWITDSVNDPLVTAAGDFQKALGCPADWAPDCLRSWLQDPDGDGVHTFTTTAIPAGRHEVKAALKLGWDVNYGADGVPGGANIPFTVATDGAATTFSYDAGSHLLSVYAGGPRPGIQARKAYWLTPQIIAWDLGAHPADQAYQLAASPEGGLRVGASGIVGGTVVPLRYDPAGLPAALRSRYPHLAGLGVLRVPADAAGRAAELLRGQLAVAAVAQDGAVTAATGLQIPGVLDALYEGRARGATLGTAFRGGVPTLSVWAPTARTVSLELYPTSTAPTATVVPMRRDDASGVWSVTGAREWKGRFYRYRVEVFVPAELKVLTNSVTDPYSLSLSADSQRSQIVDLSDPALAPGGWSTSRPPAAIPATRQEIQEVHIRDFSIADTTVPAAERGTYLAFTRSGSAGMKHLRELAQAGVTTVHLLPTFDFAGVPERRSDQAVPACDLASMPPDSDQQQACIGRVRASDGYNWGYNPLHYTVPEGSYSTSPDGSDRIRQFRQMVQALHEAGLRVVLDVVYNHTAAAGQSADSVLDRIVPGYYQRLSALGDVTTDSCCSDTAPENAMMNKVVVDSVVTWARQYRLDGFRFDLMGLDPKQTMLDVQAALARLDPRTDGVDGRNVYLYGEGWNFGVVKDDARFVQARQANMAGTGIGTFNDRLRDAVRGGSPVAGGPRVQGFASGLLSAPNGDPDNGSEADQRAALLHAMDLIKVGLTGNLRGFTFRDSSGKPATGAGIDYNGAPAGYTAAPGEGVTYVDAHDNLSLFDTLTDKLPTTTPMAARGRLQALALTTTALSQGPGFAMTGSDLMRSKTMDSDSYDSGDWVNAIPWDCRNGNGFGRGLPASAASAAPARREFIRSLLADPGLVPPCPVIGAVSAQYQDALRIKRSSPLFSLTTADAVQQRLSFPLSGAAGEIPGVITEQLDGRGLGTYRAVTVIYNATPRTQSQTLPALAGSRQALHPVQQAGADAVVRQSTFSPSTGTFGVPAYTVAVFVQQ